MMFHIYPYLWMSISLSIFVSTYIYIYVSIYDVYIHTLYHYHYLQFMYIYTYIPYVPYVSCKIIDSSSFRKNMYDLQFFSTTPPPVEVMEGQEHLTDNVAESTFKSAFRFVGGFWGTTDHGGRTHPSWGYATPPKRERLLHKVCCCHRRCYFQLSNLRKILQLVTILISQQLYNPAKTIRTQSKPTKMTSFWWKNLVFLSVLWCFLAVSVCRCLVGVENQGTSCQLDGRVGCKLSSMRESYKRTWFQNVPCLARSWWFCWVEVFGKNWTCCSIILFM